jgi:N-acyl-D-aspartate/D-glutamate deacylase
MVNACRPPEQWQTYDIIFRAAKFDAQGNQTAKTRVTVIQNGVVIHDALELAAPTPGGIDQDMKVPGPLMLQDHGNLIRYRNIWIRPL